MHAVNLALVAILLLATGTAHAADVVPKEFRGTWCSIPHEDAWPQAFHRKRPNTNCDYGWKISSTTIRSWDGQFKCPVASADGLVIGQNKGEKRPCFSAEVWYEKGTLFMSKVQP